MLRPLKRFAAIKAIYELEELRHKKHTGFHDPNLMEIYDRYVGLYGKPPEVHPVEEFAKGQTQEFLVRYIYRQHPDYFALKPVVSALFFALFGVGIIVIILGFNKNYILILIGLAILTITNIFYISLSTASRIRAMNAWVGKQIEGANLHS